MSSVVAFFLGYLIGLATTLFAMALCFSAKSRDTELEADRLVEQLKDDLDPDVIRIESHLQNQG